MPMLGMWEYSDKEVQLIKAVGLEDIAVSPHNPPVMLYVVLALECFRKNKQDAVSDSVRRCLLEMENPKTGVKRLTPEFDALIQLDEEMPSLEELIDQWEYSAKNYRTGDMYYDNEEIEYAKDIAKADIYEECAQELRKIIKKK